MDDLINLVVDLVGALVMMPRDAQAAKSCLFILHCRIALFCLCANADRARQYDRNRRPAFPAHGSVDILLNSLETLNWIAPSESIQRILEMDTDCLCDLIAQGDDDGDIGSLARRDDSFEGVMLAMYNDEEWFLAEGAFLRLIQHCSTHFPEEFITFVNLQQSSWFYQTTCLETLASTLEFCDRYMLGIYNADHVYQVRDLNSEFFDFSEVSEQLDELEDTQTENDEVISSFSDDVLTGGSEEDVSLETFSFDPDTLELDEGVSHGTPSVGSNTVDSDDFESSFIDEYTSQYSTSNQQPVKQTSETASIQSDGESSVDFFCTACRLRNVDI